MKRSFALLLAMTPVIAWSAPTVTLSGSPTSGISPLSVVLTWSSTESSSCTASGGWTGVKATSGSQVVSNLMTNTAFTLTCASATGSAELTWTAPTQNTDNTPIAATGPGSLAGFKLFHSTTVAGVATATPVVVNDKLATTYTITGLPVGVRYYGAKAFNVENIDSDMAGPVNNTIVLPSATATASIVVNVKPKPPVLTVAQVAYEVTRDNRGMYRVGKAVGSIELGMVCGDRITQKKRAMYYEVPLDYVNLTRMPKSAIVVAQCA